jgi:peptide/nickel transport system permease protein
MLRFLRRRTATSALLLIFVLLGVFVLARLTGDPTSLYLPESATAAQREAFAEVNGFNDPIWRQALTYFGNVLQLDFGTSLRTGESALDMVLRAFPATLQLAFTTMFISIVLAVIIGSWAAFRPNSIADRFASVLSMTAASVPDFFLAITGVWILAVVLDLLPTSGTDAGMLSWVLPVMTLTIGRLGVLVQVVRGAMISALSAPSVRLARSMGASDVRVVTHHALRNAAAPTLTVAGDLMVGMVNGAVIVEAIFGWPGVGKLMIDAVLGRDFAVLQVAVLVTAVSIFLLNIVIDICYALLDARVREPARI